MKKGDRVKVKTFSVRPTDWNWEGKMDKYMGRIVTIKDISNGAIRIVEDPQWLWRASQVEFIQFLLPDDLFEI